MGFKKFYAELFVHGRKREEYYVIAFRQDVWVFNEKRFEKIKHDIGAKLKIDNIEDMGIYDLMSHVREESPDIIIGQIRDNKLYISGQENWRHSTASVTMKKLLTQLKLKGVDVSYYLPHANGEIEGDVHEPTGAFSTDLKHKDFYHGTSYGALNGILRFGLTVGNNTNYKDIQHTDKVFITLNKDRALEHARHGAQKNNDVPVIIKLRVPDPDRLVVDYDLALSIYGTEHDETDSMGYSDIHYNATKGQKNYQLLKNVVARQQDNKENLVNKFGVFGYLGRIPAKFIMGVVADYNAIAQHIEMKEFGDADHDAIMQDMGGLEDWEEKTISQFYQKIKDIEEEIQSNYPADEEEEEDF
jgi:hypothetical protein